MYYIKQGIPSKPIEHYLKSRYLPRDLKLQMANPLDDAVNINTQDIQQQDIDYGFDGNVLQYFDEEKTEYVVKYEPYSELSAKGTIAGDDFCLGDPMRLTRVYKMSRNFTELANSFCNLEMLKSISADNISAVQYGAFASSRSTTGHFRHNLTSIYMPSLKNVETYFGYSIGLNEIHLNKVENFTGRVFMQQYSLRKLDLGTDADREHAPTFTFYETYAYRTFLNPYRIELSVLVPESLLDTEFNEGYWKLIREYNSSIKFIGH